MELGWVLARLPAQDTKLRLLVGVVQDHILLFWQPSELFDFGVVRRMLLPLEGLATNDLPGTVAHGRLPPHLCEGVHGAIQTCCCLDIQNLGTVLVLSLEREEARLLVGASLPLPTEFD